MRDLRKDWCYWLIILLNYCGWLAFVYYVPYVTMVTLLIYIPLTLLVISLFYGFQHRFIWLYSLIASALFQPLMWIIYLLTGASGGEIYFPIYLGVALLGQLIGWGMRCLYAGLKP